MTDAQDPRAELSDRISGALSTVWEQYSGKRPRASSRIDGDVVHCHVPDAVESFAAGIAAEAEAPGIPGRPRTQTTYKREAIGAISRTTRRQVLAFISKHDAETDIATEVFVLDATPFRRAASPIADFRNEGVRVRPEP